MWTIQVDAYNKETRRCAIRVDQRYVCYDISERPGSEILRSAVPRGTVDTLDEARRWVNGEDLLMAPLDALEGPVIEC